MLRNKSYKFDGRGDINLGYDVIMWRLDKETNMYVQDIVAEYHPDINDFTYTNHSTTQQFRDLKVSLYIFIHILQYVFIVYLT